MKLTLVLALALYAPALSTGPSIEGDYIEARTCDVWTGPCFSNSEINNTGEMAVLGWSVKSGSLNGVDLTGLKVAVALRAEGTLSTPREGKVSAVAYIDDRAGPDQGKALLDLARSLGGKYLANVVATRRAPIAYRRDGEEALLTIGEVARVRTRALMSCCDACCGNEEVAYPALGKTDGVTCAKAVEHLFMDAGLDARWSDPMKRSAMLGKFRAVAPREISSSE